MSTDLDKLLGYLEIERIDKYLFVGSSPKRPKRIFGGQVLAQSLHAAGQTVEADRFAHSLHAYFLRPGDPARQVIFEVEAIRDGRSFTTRRIVAKQDGTAIFNTAISFQSVEQGLDHQVRPPAVPPPEEVEPDTEYWGRLHRENPEAFPLPVQTRTPIERRSVVRRNPLDPQPVEPEQHIWMKARGELGDDLRRHQVMLAYMSDMALLGTALMPHPYTGLSRNLQAASLDHSLWFHRPVRADDYLLFSMDSPSAAAGRGFSRGSFYTRDGDLVASTTQESLIRIRGNLGSE